MDNRQTIIVKALNLFAAKGYDAVGVQEICDASDITKPTLYHYYVSKRGLLDAILAQYYPPFICKIQKTAEYHHDIVMNLQGLADIFSSFTQEEPDFNRFSLTAIFAPPRSEVHIAQKKYTDTIGKTVEDMFRLATGDHGNMRNKEQQLSLGFLGLLRSYVGLSLSEEMIWDMTVTRAIVKQFMHGIFS